MHTKSKKCVSPGGPLDPRFTGSNPAGGDGFFAEDKNPEYAFLWKGSEAVGPMS